MGRSNRSRYHRTRLRLRYWSQCHWWTYFRHWIRSRYWTRFHHWIRFRRRNSPHCRRQLRFRAVSPSPSLSPAVESPARWDVFVCTSSDSLALEFTVSAVSVRFDVSETVSFVGVLSGASVSPTDAFSAASVALASLSFDPTAPPSVSPDPSSVLGLQLFQSRFSSPLLSLEPVFGSVSVRVPSQGFGVVAAAPFVVPFSRRSSPPHPAVTVELAALSVSASYGPRSSGDHERHRWVGHPRTRRPKRCRRR